MCKKLEAREASTRDLLGVGGREEGGEGSSWEPWAEYPLQRGRQDTYNHRCLPRPQLSLTVTGDSPRSQPVPEPLSFASFFYQWLQQPLLLKRSVFGFNQSPCQALTPFFHTSLSSGGKFIMRNILHKPPGHAEIPQFMRPLKALHAGRRERMLISRAAALVLASYQLAL